MNELWGQLDQFLKKKRERLEHEKKLEQWREKAQKLQIWINEKSPAAENENYGASIGEVNALKDSLSRLENEIKGNELVNDTCIRVFGKYLRFIINYYRIHLDSGRTRRRIEGA